MTKFLLCVGAEKAGTTWLHRYFSQHPEFMDVGKELNVIQRDDFVPTFTKSDIFKKNLQAYFDFFFYLDQISGDFTHYEGSTENVFRLLKFGFEQRGIEIVPVYIMRDPIKRAWSAYNMMGGGEDLNMPPAADFILKSMLTCKYKETVEALDNVFPNPLYYFYETFFEQDNIDMICDRLGIARMPAALHHVVNPGSRSEPTQEFVDRFVLTNKTKDAVDFIFNKFDCIPWSQDAYC